MQFLTPPLVYFCIQERVGTRSRCTTAPALYLAPPANFFHLSSGLELKRILDIKYLGTRIWKSNKMSIPLKTIRLFNCLVVVSILLYNATTWTIDTVATTGSLLLYALIFHWNLGVNQPNNAAIFAANNLQPITTILRRRRLLTFAGHCYRSIESTPQQPIIMDILFLSLPLNERTNGLYEDAEWGDAAGKTSLQNDAMFNGGL